MNRKLLILCLCLGLGGCSFNSEYLMTYKNALKSGASTVIFKKTKIQDLNQKITGYFDERGYNNMIFADEKKGFYVFSKEGMFDEPCQIILKLTLNPNDNKIRIDLVKESDNIITDTQVVNDIEQIADQIKNEII